MIDKKYYLGIDTGGTNTDAVVYDPRTRAVVTSAKAETTHHDLVIGISEVLDKLKRLNWEGGLKSIERIHLSTTLATNSIAENLSRRIGLVLMGYDQDQEQVRQLIADLPHVIPVFVAGRHDYYGREEEDLDERAVRAAGEEYDSLVSGWAVSGFFSVKNPNHEIAASKILKTFSNKPVTMGRELTGRLDAVRRAATAALNAGLVVIIGQLLDAVRTAAAKSGLGHCRLMVVKGDGSLVSEEWAREKPIETVVSGPAAGLVGARLLARGFLTPEERNLWVLDVGGTTSDLALIRDGLPAVNPNGAKVGDWETMTMAVETRTRGLGGDSLVTLGSQGGITLGPRRVLPLCRLVHYWPETLEILRYQRSSGTSSIVGGQFFLPGVPPEPGLNKDEEAVLEALKRQTPYSMAKFAEEAFEGNHHFIGLRGLEHPCIMISAFTPTDAMTILGLYSGGNREAAELGAQIMGRHQQISPERLARLVLEEFGRVMAQEIVSHGFALDGVVYDPANFNEKGVFGAALNRRRAGNIDLKFQTRDTVILLGAPVGVLAPFLAQNLEARILIPPVFEVASAVGAAASPVHLSRRVEIHSLPNFVGFRLFLPDRVIDGRNVDALARMATGYMDEHMRYLADLAGAGQVTVNVDREDRLAALNDGSLLNLGATLTFTVAPVKAGGERKHLASGKRGIIH